MLNTLVIRKVFAEKFGIKPIILLFYICAAIPARIVHRTARNRILAQVSSVNTRTTSGLLHCIAAITVQGVPLLALMV